MGLLRGRERNAPPSALDESPPNPERAKTSLKRPLDWRQTLWRRLRSAVRLRSLYFLRAEIRFAPTEAQRLFFLTILVGVVCGLAAVAFHVSITLASHALIDQAMSAPGRSWIGWTLATPTLGALAYGVLLQYVVPNARAGAGIPQVKLRLRGAGGTPAPP